MTGTPMIAVVGVTLIDGTGHPPGEAATVIVDGNQVTSVGLARTTTVPPGATVIDARDKFLTPGLVDMHVHVHTPDKWHPELFLAAGVTTVLDLGGQLRDVAGYRAVVESGARPGPRILFTGPMLEEGEMYPGFAGFCRRFDATRTEAEVDALADAGVDGIKLYVTVRPDTSRRACTRAHERGLPVFMHQHATCGAEAALAGVDSVEHVNVFGQLAPEGFWLAEPAKLNPFEYGGWLWRWLGDLDPRSDAVRRLYDGLIAAGTALDPTLVLYAARPGAIGDDVGDTSMDDPERTRLLTLLLHAGGDGARYPVGRTPQRRPRRLRAREVSDAAGVGQHPRARRRLSTGGRNGSRGNRLSERRHRLRLLAAPRARAAGAGGALTHGGDRGGDAASGRTPGQARRLRHYRARARSRSAPAGRRPARRHPEHPADRARDRGRNRL